MKRRTGQTTIEAAVLILIVVCAALAMTVYVKRGIQGAYRDSSNQIGDQYDAKHTESDMTTTHTSSITTVIDAEETPALRTDTTKIDIAADDTTTTGTEHVLPMDVGLFD